MVKKSLFAVIMALIAVVALPSCGNNSAKSEKSEDSKDKKRLQAPPVIPKQWNSFSRWQS